MKIPVWTKAIKTCADPQRARRFLDLLAASSAAEVLRQASVDQAYVLTSLLSGSQALGNLLVTRPDWIGVLDPEMLKFPRRKQGLRHEVNRWLKPLLTASDFGAALARLREFKQREMLRIGGRDLARLGKLPEIVQAGDAVCLFFSLAERRQQHRGQDGDNGDDHKQFDERKRAATVLPAAPLVMLG